MGLVYRPKAVQPWLLARLGCRCQYRKIEFSEHHKSSRLCFPSHQVAEREVDCTLTASESYSGHVQRLPLEASSTWIVHRRYHHTSRRRQFRRSPLVDGLMSRSFSQDQKDKILNSTRQMKTLEAVHIRWRKILYLFRSGGQTQKKEIFRNEKRQ